MHNPRQWIKPMLVVVSILLLGLFANASLPQTASARFASCGGDPVVLLSNLAAIDMSVNIGTDVSNVTQIDYVIHTPPGLKVVLYIPTPTIGFKGKESFSSVEDAPSNQIITDTIVQTTSNGVPVTARIIYGLLQSKSATGFNGQHLTNTIGW